MLNLTKLVTKIVDRTLPINEPDSWDYEIKDTTKYQTNQECLITLKQDIGKLIKIRVTLEATFPGYEIESINL